MHAQTLFTEFDNCLHLLGSSDVVFVVCFGLSFMLSWFCFWCGYPFGSNTVSVFLSFLKVYELCYHMKKGKVLVEPSLYTPPVRSAL